MWHCEMFQKIKGGGRVIDFEVSSRFNLLIHPHCLEVNPKMGYGHISGAPTIYLLKLFLYFERKTTNLSALCKYICSQYRKSSYFYRKKNFKIHSLRRRGTIVRYLPTFYVCHKYVYVSFREFLILQSPDILNFIIFYCKK